MSDYQVEGTFQILTLMNFHEPLEIKYKIFNDLHWISKASARYFKSPKDHILPEKSAFVSSNISVIPSCFNGSTNSNCDSNLKRGKVT